MPGLAAGDTIYRFAATAPGTYQTMDIRRFVRDFRAAHARGRPVPTARVSTDQWRIAAPGRVRAVSYRVLDTWHAPIPAFRIYPMAGTALERDHALLNWHAVIGFPATQQGTPIVVQLRRPRGWQVATALRTTSGGAFRAASTGELVDSPVLTRRLTTARLHVTGVPVDIAAYSPTGQITATQLRGAMSGMLTAAGRFLGRLPVDRYTFLFSFADVGKDPEGAWEHSYSSAYTLREQPYTDAVGAGISRIAAHEFFHIVTPLNLHSEVVGRFNHERRCRRGTSGSTRA